MAEGFTDGASYCVVRFRYGLKLDNHNPEYAVMPAWQVREFVETPRFDGCWDEDYRREQWAKVEKLLESWGSAMVEVSSFGIVCGDFEVKPYLISAEQFHLLRFKGVA